MATRTCAVCATPIRGAAPSNARFCSGACKQRAYRRRQVERRIPAELRSADRWVTHTESKVPTRPDGRAASSTDPATWSPWSGVRDQPRRGFVLGSGFACLDLDHCLQDGVPDRAAQAVLEATRGAYVEISPSGDGLHIWGRAEERPGRRTKTFEAYSVGRYITVTGRVFRRGGLVDLSAYF